MSHRVWTLTLALPVLVVAATCARTWLGMEAAGGPGPAPPGAVCMCLGHSQLAPPAHVSVTFPCALSRRNGPIVSQTLAL